MLTRRTMIGKLLKSTTAFVLSRELSAHAETDNLLSIKLAQSAPVEVPGNFTGLGYEMSSVATPGLLSAANRRYVELVRGLGPRGVIRAGGIVANYTRYVANAHEQFDRKNTVISRAAVERFAEFLARVGWRAIWSLNFAQGTIGGAIAEARAVSDVLGSRLLAIELGNEVDSYGHGQPFRPANYDYDAYRKQFDEWHAAIIKAIPGLPFAAPDTTDRAYGWAERMAEDAKGKVQLLTTHYYRNGQKNGSLEQLLTPDPRLQQTLVRMRAASQRSGIPWRMCEINSFSGGGRPGVSDTLVGALWTLNTMLLLAQYGCAGVNMETGVNQLGFVSSYSPIQDDGKGVNSAGVPYCGMLAFASAFAGCHQLLPLEPGAVAPSLHVYVLGAEGKPRNAVILNMDSTVDARISLKSIGLNGGALLRLTAPAAGKEQVTFGGSRVDADGRWKSSAQERVKDGKISVPPMSAAVFLGTHAS